MHYYKKKHNIWIPFAVAFVLTLILGVGVLLLLAKSSETDAQDEAEEVASAIEEADDGLVKPEIYSIDYSEESSKEETEEPEPETEESVYGELLSDEEYCAENHIYAMEAADPERITLLFAGDISLAQGYAILETLKQNGGDISSAFSEQTLDMMRAADIFMVNNEFTYTRRGAPTPEKMYTFRSDPDNVHYLDDMGADIVSLANNHTYDYGEVSLLDTLETLESDGMPYVGAGRNIEEAIKPTYFIINDKRIAYVSATQIERNDYPDTKGATETSPGTFRCWQNDRVCDVIREAADCSDYVIVYVHWGTELEVEPDWGQDQLAPKLAEAGADLIIGDHPHILQRIDYIGDVPMIYSLGNYWFNSKTMDTGLLEVVLDTDANTGSVRFLPAVQKGCRTALATGEEKDRIISYMQSISPSVSIDSDGFVTKR